MSDSIAASEVSGIKNSKKRKGSQSTEAVEVLSEENERSKQKKKKISSNVIAAEPEASVKKKKKDKPALFAVLISFGSQRYDFIFRSKKTMALIWFFLEA